MTTAGRFVGVMSGTSIDAVDAVLVRIDGNQVNVEASHSADIPDNLRADIIRLCAPGEDHIDLLGRTDRALGLLFADTVQALLSRYRLAAGEITAIGSHGQTIRHRPSPGGGVTHFSLQIADANTIAAVTGITTVADFRRKDMARGGQGAPLLPAFHQAAFYRSGEHRAVVNLGGIANVTWLGASGDVRGFDTGPANGLMDAWCQRHLNLPYDEDGRWAAQGSVDQSLMDALLAHPFLAKLPPKSTGREDFNIRWLDSVLAGLPREPSPKDVQATLALFTARTVADNLTMAEHTPKKVILCGGGALNRHLAALIAAESGLAVVSSAELGIDPRRVEGAGFAWMARQTLAGLPSALASVTGADRDSVLGGIYYP
jgi:anhydro-N-acetylmuramic acid kinase